MISCGLEEGSRVQKPRTLDFVKKYIKLKIWVNFFRATFKIIETDIVTIKPTKGRGLREVKQSVEKEKFGKEKKIDRKTMVNNLKISNADVNI